MAYKETDYLQLSGIQHFAFCRRQWALMDENKDSLRFYYLGNKYKTKIEHFGNKKAYDAAGLLTV